MIRMFAEWNCSDCAKCQVWGGAEAWSIFAASGDGGNRMEASSVHRAIGGIAKHRKLFTQPNKPGATSGSGTDPRKPRTCLQTSIQPILSNIWWPCKAHLQSKRRKYAGVMARQGTRSMWWIVDRIFFNNGYELKGSELGLQHYFHKAS